MESLTTASLSPFFLPPKPNRSRLKPHRMLTSTLIIHFCTGAFAYKAVINISADVVSRIN